MKEKRRERRRRRKIHESDEWRFWSSFNNSGSVIRRKIRLPWAFNLV